MVEVKTEEAYPLHSTRNVAGLVIVSCIRKDSTGANLLATHDICQYATTEQKWKNPNLYLNYVNDEIEGSNTAKNVYEISKSADFFVHF